MRAVSLSTEQVLAFVELARVGSLHTAAQNVHLSDEGLRARILALEQTLRVSLYEKSRGRRADVKLTVAGRRFLQRAGRFLEHARELTSLFDAPSAEKTVHLLASHYGLQSIVSPVTKALLGLHPDVLLRLSSRAETAIPQLLLNESSLCIGVCTPSEFPNELHYQKLRCTSWCVAVPKQHPFASRKSLALQDLIHEPLVTFERGSSGRMHILESFYAKGLEPKVGIEVGSSALILRAVQDGLGIALVTEAAFHDLAHSLDVTRVALADPVRSIETGIYVRQEFRQHPIYLDFLAFATTQAQAMPLPSKIADSALHDISTERSGKPLRLVNDSSMRCA
jgi:DNA-binding transcriptional LysR family regulator